eukprot:1820525-Amphidinium_carterae.1
MELRGTQIFVLETPEELQEKACVGSWLQTEHLDGLSFCRSMLWYSKTGSPNVSWIKLVWDTWMWAVGCEFHQTAMQHGT